MRSAGTAGAVGQHGWSARSASTVGWRGRSARSVGAVGWQNRSAGAVPRGRNCPIFHFEFLARGPTVDGIIDARDRKFFGFFFENFGPIFGPPRGPQNGPRDPGDRFKIEKKILNVYLIWAPGRAQGPPKWAQGPWGSIQNRKKKKNTFFYLLYKSGCFVTSDKFDVNFIKTI